MAVAPSSGHCDCLTTSIAAFVRLSPFSAATSTASVMTMALSTSIPSAMMNAPSEVTLKQLRELHIEVKLPKKQEKPAQE